MCLQVLFLHSTFGNVFPTSIHKLFSKKLLPNQPVIFSKKPINSPTTIILLVLIFVFNDFFIFYNLIFNRLKRLNTEMIAIVFPFLFEPKILSPQSPHTQNHYFQHYDSNRFSFHHQLLKLVPKHLF